MVQVSLHTGNVNPLLAGILSQLCILLVQQKTGRTLLRFLNFASLLGALLHCTGIKIGLFRLTNTVMSNLGY